MEGSSSISPDVLATYAADAAREVPGVRELAESGRHRHRGVRVSDGDDAVTVELHVVLDWGAGAGEVGGRVQDRVADYLRRMAHVEPGAVDVVVDEVGPPPEVA
jgi:uncharacterized alkaline shock family protein YloU